MLFAGPVNETSFILSKFIGQLFVFLGLSLLCLLFFFFVAQILNLAPRGLGLLFLKSFLGGLCVISFGILLSSLMRKMAASVIVYLLIVVLSVLGAVAGKILGNLVSTTGSKVVLFAATGIQTINAASNWILPFNGWSLGSGYNGVLFSALYIPAMLFFSILVLKRSGVR